MTKKRHTSKIFTAALLRTALLLLMMVGGVNGAWGVNRTVSFTNQNRISNNGAGVFTTASNAGNQYALALADLSSIPGITTAGLVTIQFDSYIATGTRWLIGIGDKEIRGTTANGSSGSSYNNTGLLCFWGNDLDTRYKFNGITQQNNALGVNVHAEITFNRIVGTYSYTLKNKDDNSVVYFSGTDVSPLNSSFASPTVVEAYSWANGSNITLSNVTVQYDDLYFEQAEDVIYLEDLVYQKLTNNTNSHATCSSDGYLRLEDNNNNNQVNNKQLYPIRTTGSIQEDITEGAPITVTVTAGSASAMCKLRIKTRNELDINSMKLGDVFTVGTTLGTLPANSSITINGVRLTLSNGGSHSPVVRNIGDGYGLTIIDGNGYTFGNYADSKDWGTVYKFENTTGNAKTIYVTGYFDSNSGNAQLYDNTHTAVNGQTITNPGNGTLASGSLTLGANSTYYLYSQWHVFALNTFSGPRFENSYAVTSIGSAYTQTVSYMASPAYSIVAKVGDISSEDVKVSSSGEVSGLTKGGAVKIQATNGVETVSYVLTVAYEASAYPGHVWDFYSVEKGLTTTDDFKVEPNPSNDVSIKTGLNGYSWKAEYKNVNTNERPEWYLQDAVRGDNAFIVPETAGLIFVNNARNFFLRNDENTYSHIGIRGNGGGTSFTIPKLKKGDIVELLWKRESDGSGHKFTATNLTDLRGKEITEIFEITESAQRNIRRYVGPYSFVVTDDGDVSFKMVDNGNNDIQTIRIYNGGYQPTMNRIRLQSNVAAPTTLLLDNQEDGYTYTYCNQLYSTATGPAMYVLKGYDPDRDDESCIKGATSASAVTQDDCVIVKDENAYPITKEESDRLYEMRKNLVGFKMYNTPWVRGAGYPTYNYGHIDATSGWGKVTIRMNNYTVDMKYLIGYTPDFTLNIGSAPHQKYPYTWDFTNISAQEVTGKADNVYNTIRQRNESDAFYDEYDTNWTEEENDVITLNTTNTGQFDSQYVPGAVLVTTNRALSKFNGASEDKYAKDELDGIGVNGQISIHGNATRNAARTRAATEELLSFKVGDYVSLDESDPHVATGTNLAAGSGWVQFGADKAELQEIDINGTLSDIYAFKCDGDITADKNSSKFIQLTPSRSFKTGDIISLDVFATSTPNGNDYGISFYKANTAGASAIHTIYIPNGTAKNTLKTLSYTVSEGDNIEGLSSIYVLRPYTKSTYIVDGSIEGEPAETATSIITEMYCQTPTTLTIPDLNALDADGVTRKQDWIYVSASQAPLKVVNGQDTETYLDDDNHEQTRTVDHLLNPVTTAEGGGPDANTANHVYKYKVENPGSADITFDAGTKIYKIGVTHILKEMHPVGGIGWATEIRKHSIDHTLTGYFTKNDANAYTVAYDSYDMKTATVALTPINEDGYVPDRTGIVMRLDNASGLTDANAGKNVPLFYPSYTRPQTSTAVDFPANNLMYNVEEGIDNDNRNYNERINVSGADYTKFILTNIHWTYDLSHTLNADEASTAISETDAAGFYRMHIWKTTGEADVAAKNTMPKNSAYLLVPTEELPIAVWDMQQGASSGARQNTLGIRYSNGQSTSIEDVDTKAYQAVDKGTASDSGETWYTLSGIRLARRPSKEGLYICNGRKVLIKQ